jgi:protein TonB
MKKILIMFLFLSSAVAFAQITSENVDEVAAQEKSVQNSDITKSKDYPILKTKIDLTDVYTTADTPPEFPGGINQFRKKYMEIFETNLDEKSGTVLRATAYFIIEKDGKMSNITAIGDKRLSGDAVKALKKIKMVWKPAIIGGEPVRFLFNYPLTMSF